MLDVIQNKEEQDVYVFPTSYAQQRLWFLDQFEPNSPFYNIPSAVRFRGPLNRDALEQAINEVIRRHETLRTTFTKAEGKPVQVIHPFSPMTIPQDDLSHLPEEQREAEAMRLATLEARQPFNLSKGPLVRVKLLRLDEQEHVVLFNMHHIISDGWSIGVLIQEIAILYDAFLKGKSSPLPELPIQYADFAVWQQEWLTGEVLDAQLDYWKDQLNGKYGKLQVLELPTDRPRPAIQTSNGDTVDVLMPRKLGDELKALSSKEGATFFMTLTAAFQVLLNRYTGQEDISIGSPIANRTRGEIENLIGFFVNTLILRTDLSADPTFCQLLKKVKEITLEAYANQDIPFERLVELVQPERDMSHSPLFQVMFILQNNPMNGDTELPGVSLSTLNINAGTSTFDLTLMVAEQVNGLNISVEYNTDLFDNSTIERMLKHFQVLLEGIVADPGERISMLPILTAEEKNKVIVDWNDYTAEYPKGLCIHQLFEAQVEFTPDAIAVAYDGQYLTYRELDKRANQLAHYLRKRGIKPEILVGICADKSLELIVGVMGTVKAGGAYLPIDPTYPPERISHMLEDADVSVLLTQERIVENLPAHDAEIVCLDSDWDKISRESSVTPAINVTPDSLVYVIYTSGSTGKSKGVMVMHKTLVNQYKAWEETFGLRTEATGHLQMASFSFDVFSGDFVRALCSGGKLVLVSRDLLLEADKLYQLMTREKVDIAEFVPAVLRNLIQYLDESGQNLEFMRVLIAGSDIWFVGEYKKFLKFCGPNTRLLNTFGLTEATIDSTYFERLDLSLSLERLVPIGIPFNNTQIYILDFNAQPVPIGVPGELCVGGAGLARGYLNRADLTADKFIPNPFSEISGDRLYRTGDSARFLGDGNIEFLGRIDNQVKIRGFRIELGEIESALGKHDNVKEVAVTAREDKPGSKQLVAYIVTSNGVQPTAGDFHNFLKEDLPDYMVPSYFVFLDTMPLTPNGKIDRRSLPEPDQESAAVSAKEYIAPRTPSEEVLARIWSQILGIDRVGVNDNFFELGGHSLLATQVISRIRDAFDVELPLRNIFEFPFVEELAKKIDIALLSEHGLEAPPIQPTSRDQELPLSFAQQRLWFLDQLEPNSPFYNIPEALRFSGHLDIPALEQGLNEIVRRHESLRTTFRAKAGRPFQVIHPDMTIPLKQIDLRGIPKEDRENEIINIARQEAREPFDLSTGPLLRAVLVRVDADEYVVFYTMHHIIGDDWSSNVLVQEIVISYDACSHGRPNPLPDLTIQYADFAYWQQQWLQGEILEKQLNYWKKQFAGAPQLLELPTDRPRPPVQTFNGSYQTFEFSEELTNAIKDLSTKEGATIFMTLLAAFQTLLYRYSGQDDICVGSPIANRTKAEMESMIGFFVNTLVLRTDLSGKPNFKELLKRVREVALGAYAHQDLPFEKLVDAIKPQRDLSHTPLFQVMFAIQNSPKQAVDVSGMTMAPVESHSGTSKFDLTLFMLEEGKKLSGALEYNTDLFDDSTIVRLLKHFEMLLLGIIAEPEKAINEISILTESEQQQAIVEWNATQVQYPQNQFVHQLIEAQVEKTPGLAAVVFGTEQLTYQELNQSANQLAHQLQKLGVTQENLVGVCMERSLEVMVANLAVLKAGGAYVPIDPAYPSERIAYMLEDSNVAVLLTQERLKSMLPDVGIPVISMDADWGTISGESDANPGINLAGENLAYVIYTSGSTGKPKGTLIPHSGLMNYLNWCLKTYPIEAGRGSLVHSSLAFDATITGLYAPLLAGRSVYMIPETNDLEIVTTVLKAHKNFSLVKITPAHLEMIGEQLESEDAADLVRAFIIGGENLTTEHIAFWQTNAPATKLVNEYGPTETVVGCMNYDTPLDLQKVGSVPIGFPIANMQIYLLDSTFQPVPIGVAGEMYIGGAGVARGYLNRPDLTAEKFIPDPFNQEPGSRLYKSGDLARYLPDGNIEFLGRIDHQVKIRGFRIELGEIEAILGQHPAIREIVVIDWKVDSDTRLVAYIVPEDEDMPAIDDLREFLKEKLPEYMIPSAYVRLTEVPLTPNGKVDRKALPEPEITRAEMKKEFVAPRTWTERELANIWIDLIKIDQVGIHDTFFELGGHSLLATQLISRVREHFKVELPLVTIFESPTLTAFAERIEKSKITTGQVEASEIKPVPRDEDIELVLSFSQQRLWFLDQMDPGQTFYNIPSSVRLQGKLNLPAFELSLREVIRRHEILRTTFAEVKGRPIQVITNEFQFILPQVDLTELGEKDQEIEITRLGNENAQQPFNLEKGPLFRATLLKLKAEDHVVLFTMHHIISDGWSVNLLMQDVGAIYYAFSQGQPSSLPELSIQFADYAYWQRQWLTGEVLEKQLMYWKKKLINVPSLLELPTDRPRPAIKTFNGSLRSFEISKENADALNQLAQQHDVTLFMLLIAAFKMLLYRYSGQGDISIGTPIANRTRHEAEALIGFFANTMVLRTDLSGDPSFVELLKRVKGVCLGAYANQDIPFEKLVETVQPERDMSHTPLFQVLFTLQNNPLPTMESSDMKMIPIMSEIGTTQFDLTLSVEEGSEGMAGVLEYNTDLFNGETIEQMIQHLKMLLRNIVVDPEQRISMLPVLNQNEKEKYLFEWNNTRAEYPNKNCIHELFETQVEKTPDSLAVVFENQKLTYRELNQRANQLANYIQTLGAGPEIVIGISVERSVEMVVGLLGIMKSGSAYLPIDPSYPKDRIIYMLADAGLPVLLTQEKLLANLPLNGTKPICLDKDWELIAQENDGNIVNDATIDNLAYMIYTSGSTGRPKGVMLQHRGLCNLTHSQIQDFAVNADSRVLQFASFSFDASVSEIFMALLTGATLYLASRDTLMSAPELVQLFRNEQITTVTLPPSLLKVLPNDNLDMLSTIISAGEACTKDIARRWAKGRRLLNAYGPTEATIGVTSYLVERISTEGTTIPIGKPINNTQLYILDHNLNPVPRGVNGELFIGSIGLARGYHNRPDLTAEKFIPDPFSNEPGMRLYRTGDLARFLSDGNIEFLGRIDHQVKVRGFRIELGEIESALIQHPEILEVVVLAKEMNLAGREKRLIAYIVSQKEDSPKSNELREFLKDKLPEYIVPSIFMKLPALPLTPNGKVDRKALPEPDMADIDMGVPFIAPNTETEKLLADIWCEYLGLEKVGIKHNFFELGGHSLIATQLASRIRDTFHAELPIRNLFESPTIEELAKVIDSSTQVDSGSTDIAIESISREKDIPLSYAQQRLWFLDQLEPNLPFYNLPTAVRLSGKLNVKALHDSLNEVVRRHEILRTTFDKRDGRPVQVIKKQLNIPLPIVDISGLTFEAQQIEAKRLATEDAQRPFCLLQLPLLRVTLVKLSEEEFVFLLNLHHIISDGWSMNIFINEVAVLYESFSRELSLSLPDLSIQYADFAYWQRQWLQGEVLEAQLNYWKKQLAGISPLLELPTDRPRPAVQTFNGNTIAFEISNEISIGMKELSQQEGTTLYTALLAAFQTLLYRYSGQHDISVGTPIANRNRSEIEGLIGFFVNTLVIRSELSGKSNFRQLISRMKEITLGAYANQDLPFEMVVDEIQPERNMSFSPLFQVVFTLQTTPKTTQEMTDISFSPVDAESGIAKFDITLSMVEQGEKLGGTFEYNTDLFDEATIQRMIKHFRMLLQGIVSNPDQKIAELPLLIESEKQQMVLEWNQTLNAVPLDKCAHELFEAQAMKTPEALAVSMDGVTITYFELNRKANRLAHYLQRLGVQPEILVAICVDRSIDMIVGLLAILKAGGAYVPIDPAYPAERIEYMLEDTQSQVLLTQVSIKAKLPQTRAHAILLDQTTAIIEQESDRNPVSNVNSGNLAYTIYTSGSTGLPKGVTINHKGLLDLIFWHKQAFRITPADRATQLAGQGFDASVWEIWPYLTTGASVHIPDEETRLLPTQMQDWLVKNDITITFLPTPMAETMLSLEWQSNSALRILLTGGDKLHHYPSPDLPFKLVNNYGPTEVTVVSTSGKVCSQVETGIAPSIGRPISNTEIYILDSQLQPVPLGARGEVYISGNRLARGYLNRPDLTADMFIPNPFINEPGARMYRTGDLARYLPTGEIEFLGRIDYQVKIRGFRIELGEIEAILNQYTDLKEIFVMVQEDIPGNKRIIAYIIPQPEAGLEINEVRSFLNEKLPDYMVPSAFVILEKFPVTPNGKIDRRALPAPDYDDAEREKKFVAPRTEEEKLLADAWKSVLGIEKIGIYDNFFEIGGDSIQTIQVISRANQAGLQITPKHLFQNPTIESLVKVIGTGGTAHAEQGVVVGSVPLTPVQHWFFEHHPEDPHQFNTSMFLELGYSPDIGLLNQTIQHIMSHHDALRLRFTKTESGWHQVNAGMDEEIPFIAVDLSAIKSKQQKEIIESIAAEVQTSLNLSTGPLFRTIYFDRGSKKTNRLLFVFHHLVMDGVSWRIFMEDFINTYQQLHQEKTVQLPLKTTSFKYWSERLTGYAQQMNAREEMDYWMNIGINAKDVKPLPLDFPEGINTYGSTENITLSLGRNETQALLKKVPQAFGAEIFDVMVTALIRLFNNWTGERKFLIETEGHGREMILDDVDLSRSIGWFTSMFPVFLNIDNSNKMEDQVDLVKDQLHSVPNKGIGFGVLRYRGEDEEVKDQLSKIPEPDVNFNYLGQFDQMPSEPQEQAVPMRMAKESVGPEQSERVERNSALYIVGIVNGGQLHVRWLYSRNIHKRSTIKKLAKGYIEELQKIIQYSTSIAGRDD